MGDDVVVRVARPLSIGQVFEKAAGREILGLERIGSSVEVSEQLFKAWGHAEREGDEDRAEAYEIEYTDQLLWECRAALHETVANLGALWPGRKYELAVLLLREMMELNGEAPKRKALDNRTRRVVYERDSWQCVECGELETLTVDHIVPVHLGGTNDEGNLRTLCRPCNSSKGARL